MDRVVLEGFVQVFRFGLENWRQGSTGGAMREFFDETYSHEDDIFGCIKRITEGKGESGRDEVGAVEKA